MTCAVRPHHGAAAVENKVLCGLVLFEGFALRLRRTRAVSPDSKFKKIQAIPSLYSGLALSRNREKKKSIIAIPPYPRLAQFTLRLPTRARPNLFSGD